MPNRSTGPCNPACSTTIEFIKNRDLPPNTGTKSLPYKKISGYRYINIFLEFTQTASDELPVDLGIMFALSSSGEMEIRRYVSLDENASAPQSTNFMSVSGAGTWSGSPTNKSRYLVRLPVMGPFISVLPFNRGETARKVSIRGYLVS